MRTDPTRCRLDGRCSWPACSLEAGQCWTPRQLVAAGIDPFLSGDFGRSSFERAALARLYGEAWFAVDDGRESAA